MSVNFELNEREARVSEERTQKVIADLRRERDECRTSLHDFEDRISALLEAASLIARLASTSPEMQKESSKKLSTIKDGKDHDISIHRRIDELKSTWKLEETAFPSLLERIQILQSNSKLNQQEADSVITENSALRKSLQENSTKAEKLEKALTKLHKENKKLKSKIEKSTKEKKSVLKSVKEYMSSAHIRDKIHAEKVVAMEMQLHERCLTTPEKYDDDDSVVSTLSSVSTASFITDDGIATVRLFNDDGGWGKNTASPSPSLIHGEMRGVAQQSHIFRIQQSPLKQSPSYRISFKQGKSIGLQLFRIPLDSKGSFSGLGLLNGMMTEDLDNFDPIDSRTGGIPENCGLLVCGFEGFNEDLYVRPTFGARLISIGDESFESSNLTMEGMHEKLQSKINSGKSFSVAFRNDSLSKRHRDILNKASLIVSDMKGSSGIKNGSSQDIRNKASLIVADMKGSFGITTCASYDSQDNFEGILNFPLQAHILVMEDDLAQNRSLDEVDVVGPSANGEKKGGKVMPKLGLTTRFKSFF